MLFDDHIEATNEDLSEIDFVDTEEDDGCNTRVPSFFTPRSSKVVRESPQNCLTFQPRHGKVFVYLYLKRR